MSGHRPCSRDLKNAMRHTSLLVSLASAIIMLLMVGGCASSKPSNVSISSIRGNLTPKVRGTSETSYDIDNNLAIIGNIQLRQASDDLDRIFLFDQPSTLSPYLIVPTGRDP